LGIAGPRNGEKLAVRILLGAFEKGGEILKNGKKTRLPGIWWGKLCLLAKSERLFRAMFVAIGCREFEELGKGKPNHLRCGYRVCGVWGGKG